MIYTLHRMSAVIIGTFVLVHLINHLCILDGAQSHIAFMDAFRQVYRHLVAESILLLCVMFQIISGIYFVWRRWGQRSGFIEKAQAFSGLYLAFFFINHIGAVLYGRFVAQLDTNIYFGIAGFHHPPFHYYFMPYYFLAVVAIFVHVAAAFNWLTRDKMPPSARHHLAYLIMAIGCLLSLVLILGFNGWFNEIVIPQQYNEFYG